MRKLRLIAVNWTRKATDHPGDLIKRFYQKTGQSSTQSTPFKPIKGRKNNRKSPSPPPESASKKLKITKVETTNRFSNLQIEDPPIIEDEQEERDEDVPQARPPRFRPPPRSRLTTSTTLPHS
ncbi:hypothetical protein TNCV_591311 [Trichonephila clavipes]|nr:hypothetical protein TNCV_591311 [Trichonephila clavipes]